MYLTETHLIIHVFSIRRPIQRRKVKMYVATVYCKQKDIHTRVEHCYHLDGTNVTRGVCNNKKDLTVGVLSDKLSKCNIQLRPRCMK